MKKCKKRLIFHTFWLDICKLIRIRIHLIHLDGDPDFYLMRTLIRTRFQVTKMMRILPDTDPQHWSTAQSKEYCYIAILDEVLWVQQCGNVTPLLPSFPIAGVVDLDPVNPELPGLLDP